MKKPIAFVALCGLFLVGCAHGGAASSGTASSTALASFTTASSSASVLTTSSTSISTMSSSSSPALVVSVTLAGPDTVVLGETITLTATVAGATDTTVTWAASAVDIAVVSAGVVSPLKAGVVTITATSVADPTKSASKDITVTNPVLDASVVTVEANYTIAVSNYLAENPLKIYQVADAGIFEKTEKNGIYFVDEKVYGIKAFSDGSGYFYNESMLVKATKSQVQASVNIATLMAATRWTYSSGADEAKATTLTYLASTKDETNPFLTYAAGLVSDDFLATNPDAVAYVDIGKDDNQPSEIDLFASATDVNPLKILTFSSIKTTTLDVTPVYSAFDKGGTADSGGGAGENF